MNCEETTALLMDRLQSKLPAADEERLAAHLESCAACRAEAGALAETWAHLASIDDDEVPHERLRARFYAGLAAYEERERGRWLERLLERWWPKEPALQLGLAATLALAGVLVGRVLPSPFDAEVAALRDEVRLVGLALLDHQSASERLLGVQWSRRTAQTPEVVAALLERVRYDSNPSVRLAAVDALRAALDRREVVDGLAMALELQESPLLQVALTDALLEADDGTATAAVRALLGRDDLDPAVREYLETALGEPAAGAPASTGA
jgi:anti-sigma factor RsiW